jgi:hypothetical protein
MHQFLKIYGALNIVAGLVLAVMLMKAGAAGLLLAVVIGFGAVLSGAMLYCSGAIVEHLVELRSLSARQLALFEQMAGRKTVDTRLWSARDRDAHGGVAEPKIDF